MQRGIWRCEYCGGNMSIDDVHSRQTTAGCEANVRRGQGGFQEAEQGAATTTETRFGDGILGNALEASNAKSL